MIVAVDGRRLQDRPLIGAGRWLANLLPLLEAQVEITVLSDARRCRASSAQREVMLPAPARTPEVVWLQWSAARWLRSHPAIFHGTFNAVPLAWRGRSVVTIFDLSFETHPEDHTPGRRRVFAHQARSAARRSDAVITVSEHARSEIIDRYGTDPERVLVARPAVDPVFVAPDRGPAAALLRSVGARAERYVVAVGGARRRGVEVAEQAWRQARSAGVDLDLVIVGGDRAAPASGGVAHLGRIDDGLWAGVLAGARALCYPTRYEGFGMPALEAAACGVPVVCGRVGPLPEVLGDAAEWCDESDPGSVAEALERVVVGSDRHAHLSAAGRARAQSAPSWVDAAEVVLRAYRLAAM